MLEEIEHEGGLSIDFFESILDAIHVEGIFLNTAFSYIFDLQSGDVYAYYFHQFEDVVEFNLVEELAHDPLFLDDTGICSGYCLPRLVSQETNDKVTSELRGYKIKFFLIIVFGVAVLSCGGFFIYKKIRNRRTVDLLS
ncbi:MAG: hypothetical protein HXS48_14050 [Theionarchaea archaeon]|nr:hypothetical protein [Theionarchaea archaeon]